MFDSISCHFLPLYHGTIRIKQQHICAITNDSVPEATTDISCTPDGQLFFKWYAWIPRTRQHQIETLNRELVQPIWNNNNNIMVPEQREIQIFLGKSS